MKKLFIIIIILLLASVIVSAKLNDETLKDVENLRYKHYGYKNIYINPYSDFISIDSADTLTINNSEWQVVYRNERN